MITMMFITLVFCSAQNRYSYLQAQKRMDTDLKILEKAKEYAASAAFAKRCYQSSLSKSEKTETVEGIEVQFFVQDTYVQAEYEDGQGIWTLQLLYDENGIAEIKYLQ